MKKKTRQEKDPKKEQLFRRLSEILKCVGVEVRREELKSGYGWRAVSGACRLNEQPLLFIDRKIPQDEQISLLLERLTLLADRITPDQLSDLPESIIQRLMPIAA